MSKAAACKLSILIGLDQHTECHSGTDVRNWSELTIALSIVGLSTLIGDIYIWMLYGLANGLEIHHEMGSGGDQILAHEGHAQQSPSLVASLFHSSLFISDHCLLGIIKPDFFVPRLIKLPVGPCPPHD